jgi:anti-sigma B factor antagonist
LATSPARQALARDSSAPSNQVRPEGAIAMRLERKSEGRQAVVLAVHGSLQGGADADLFMGEIDRLMAEGRRNVLVDMKSLTWINSTGLGILLAAHATVRRTGGEMKIVHLSDTVENLLAVTKLNRIFEVYGDEVEALRSFSPG